MNKLSKKEIKEIKRNIKENGIYYYGFYHTLHSETSNINYYALIEAAGEVAQLGMDYANDRFSDAVIEVFCNKIGYQDFKKVVPHLIGRTHYRLINNQLVSTEVF